MLSHFWGASVEKMKLALISGYALYTGSSNGDWAKVWVTHIYSQKTSFSGHAFCIVGYDDVRKVFVVKNSWWPAWWDNGYFYLRYEDVHMLYSIYIQLDSSDIDALRDIRNNLVKLNSLKAKNAGIWNWENPDMLASDREIVAMCSRGLELTMAYNRTFWATTFNEMIVRDKAVLNIWNKREWERLATEKEIATMFTRAVTRDGNSASWRLTRLQVAVVVGRDLM